MKAYTYKKLLIEYKRRIAMNEVIGKRLQDDSFVGFYRKSAEKEFARNAEIASDLLAQAKSAKKEGLVYA